jgi:hypothetical protein
MKFELGTDAKLSQRKVVNKEQGSPVTANLPILNLRISLSRLLDSTRKPEISQPVDGKQHLLDNLICLTPNL